MAGTILENLSGKKLTILVSILLICQLICFLIGGLMGMPDTESRNNFPNNKSAFVICSSGSSKCSNGLRNGVQGYAELV